MRNKVKNKKIIILIAIPILLLILGIILIIFIRGNKREQPKVYQRIVLKNYIPQYKLTQDFTFENELTIAPSKDNFYYRSGDIRDLAPIRAAAGKLGLSKENSDPLSQIYLWSKDDNTQINAMTLSFNTGILNLNYQDGVNSDTVDGKNSYQYMKEFFGQNNLDTSLKYENKLDEETSTYAFKQSYLDKEIYFDQGIDTVSNIRMTKGKIIEFYTYLTNKNLTKGNELEPLTNISNSNIQSLNYFMNFEPSNTVATSLYGAETQFIRPVSIRMKEYTDVFYYRIESNTFVLYPAIKISGDYIDNKNHSGKVTIIVINQTPSIAN